MIQFDQAYAIYSALPQEREILTLQISYDTYDRSRKYFDYYFDRYFTEQVEDIDNVIIFQDAMDGSDNFLPYVDWFTAREAMSELRGELEGVGA